MGYMKPVKNKEGKYVQPPTPKPPTVTVTSGKRYDMVTIKTGEQARTIYVPPGEYPANQPGYTISEAQSKYLTDQVNKNANQPTKAQQVFNETALYSYNLQEQPTEIRDNTTGRIIGYESPERQQSVSLPKQYIYTSKDISRYEQQNKADYLRQNPTISAMKDEQKPGDSSSPYPYTAFQQRVENLQSSEYAYFNSAGFQRINEAAEVGTNLIMYSPAGWLIGRERTKSLLQGYMSLVPATAGYFYFLGGKLGATAEGLTIPAARKEVVKEYLDSTHKEEYTNIFNPLSVQGFTTWTNVLLGAVPVARKMIAAKNKAVITGRKNEITERRINQIDNTAATVVKNELDITIGKKTYKVLGVGSQNSEFKTDYSLDRGAYQYKIIPAKNTAVKVSVRAESYGDMPIFKQAGAQRGTYNFNKAQVIQQDTLGYTYFTKESYQGAGTYSNYNLMIRKVDSGIVAYKGYLSNNVNNLPSYKTILYSEKIGSISKVPGKTDYTITGRTGIKITIGNKEYTTYYKTLKGRTLGEYHHTTKQSYADFFKHDSPESLISTAAHETPGHSDFKGSVNLRKLPVREQKIIETYINKRYSKTTYPSLNDRFEEFIADSVSRAITGEKSPLKNIPTFRASLKQAAVERGISEGDLSITRTEKSYIRVTQPSKIINTKPGEIRTGTSTQIYEESQNSAVRQLFINNEDIIDANSFTESFNIIKNKPKTETYSGVVWTKTGTSGETILAGPSAPPPVSQQILEQTAVSQVKSIFMTEALREANFKTAVITLAAAKMNPVNQEQRPAAVTVTESRIIQDIKPIYINESRAEQQIKPLQISIIKHQQKTKTSLFQDQKPVSITEQEQRPVQEEIQEQLPILITEQQQRLRQDTGQTTTPIQAQTSFLGFGHISGPGQQQKGQNLFTTLVRRGGLFSAVGSPQPLKQAIGLGIRTVKMTAAASFKVVGAPAGTVRRGTPGLFYESKKEPGVFIQRRENRISSAGEKREITFKGIMSQKIRGFRA